MYSKPNFWFPLHCKYVNKRKKYLLKVLTIYPRINLSDKIYILNPTKLGVVTTLNPVMVEFIFYQELWKIYLTVN